MSRDRCPNYFAPMDRTIDNMEERPRYDRKQELTPAKTAI